MNKLLMQMIGVESRAAMGAPVLLSGLRERLPEMSKADFYSYPLQYSHQPGSTQLEHWAADTMPLMGE